MDVIDKMVGYLVKDRRWNEAESVIRTAHEARALPDSQLTIISVKYGLSPRYYHTS